MQDPAEEKSSKNEGKGEVKQQEILTPQVILMRTLKQGIQGEQSYLNLLPQELLLQVFLGLLNQFKKELEAYLGKGSGNYDKALSKFNEAWEGIVNEDFWKAIYIEKFESNPSLGDETTWQQKYINAWKALSAAKTEDDATLLIKASELGFDKIVKEILNKKKGQWGTETYSTALWRAIWSKNNQTTCLELLLNDMPSTLNDVISEEMIAKALLTNRPEVFDTLLNHINVERLDSVLTKKPILHQLVKNNFIQSIENIITKVTKETLNKMLIQLDEFQVTPLFHAIGFGREEITKLLLELDKENDNASQKMMETFTESSLLHLAASHDNEKLIQIVMNGYGENNIPINKEGLTPLHTATKFKNERTIEFLAKKMPSSIIQADRQGQLPIHYAISASELVLVRLFLEIQPNLTEYVNKKDGNTLLHLAIKQLGEKKSRLHHRAIINLLIEKTSPETILFKNSDGQTPLHLAVMNKAAGNIIEILALVEKNPEAINQTNSQGNLPLHQAISYQNNDAILLFLSLKPEQAFQVNGDKQTPLHMLLETDNRNKEILNLVIKNISKDALNAKDKNGNTALHIAATKGNDVAVKLLLKNPLVDTTLTDNKGKTAKDLAHFDEVKKLFKPPKETKAASVKKLLKKIAKINPQDEKVFNYLHQVYEFILKNQYVLQHETGFMGLLGSDKGKTSSWKSVVLALQEKTLESIKRHPELDDKTLEQCKEIFALKPYRVSSIGETDYQAEFEKLYSSFKEQKPK